MHHQGKDTHIRLVKIFSPLTYTQNESYQLMDQQKITLR